MKTDLLACSKAHSQNSMIDIFRAILTVIRMVDTFFVKTKVLNDLNILSSIAYYKLQTKMSLEI